MPAAPIPRPLVVTRDPVLLDELLRLAAVAGVEPVVAPGLGAARAAWSSAPLVLVGADSAGGGRDAGGAGGAADGSGATMPRRRRVVVVSRDLDDADVWRRAVGVGAEHVAVLPDAEAWLVDQLAEPVEESSPAPVLACIAGRGGAGATTLACALAVTAQRLGAAALLIDADPLGGGIDLALGAEDAAGLRWPDLAGAEGRIPPAALAEALPARAGLQVLSWDRSDTPQVPALALDALLTAAVRAAALVVVDLPRAFDDATVQALSRSGTTLLVVPAEVRACAAGARVAAAAARHCSDLRVVVRGPAPGGLAAGDVAAAVGLPLAGALRAEPGLAAALERGEPPGSRARGPLAHLCEDLLEPLLQTGLRPGRAAA